MEYLLRMPANRLPTSPAVGSFLRGQRRRLGYTLRDVEKLSDQGGGAIPYSTLARIEKGTLDPGLRRLHQLLRVYHVPLQVAGDLLDLEHFAGELPTEKDPLRLYRMGRDAWQRGDTRAGLSAFVALGRLDKEIDPLLRQKALLALSTVAGALGKFEFAKHVIDSLLLEPPDPTILVSVLVQASKCWQWLGSPVVASALVEAARERLTKSAPPHQHAFVFHQRASVLVSLEEFDAAEEAVELALAAYRRAKDESGYCKTLGLRIWIQFDRGDVDRALLAAQAARMYAQRHAIARLRMLYSISEARAHLLLGNVTSALSHLGQVLADAVGCGDNLVRFYTHYYFWQVYRKTGDEARAEIEFETAARFLESLDEVTPEATHVRSLLSTRRHSRTRGGPTSDGSGAPGGGDGLVGRPGRSRRSQR